MIRLDETDFRILDILQKNAKATISDIAVECNLSRTPIFDRIRKMEDNGVIKSYKANVNADAIGLPLHAFCNISLKEHAAEFLVQFEQEITNLPEVVAVYHTAGLFDYLLEIRAAHMEAYRNFIAKKLAGIDNIGNVQSFFIMNVLKDGSQLPLNNSFDQSHG